MTMFCVAGHGWVCRAGQWRTPSHTVTACLPYILGEEWHQTASVSCLHHRGTNPCCAESDREATSQVKPVQGQGWQAHARACAPDLCSINRTLCP